MSTLPAGHVTTATDAAGITTITFFHPAHNSLPAAILAQLAAAITQAGHDEATKVVILQSEGERTFCAGASFDELRAVADAAQGLAFFCGFAHVINACRTCPKLLIGRVQGKAVGGGVGLAAATDYCLATTQAAVKLSELAVGIGPFVVGPAVERKIGASAFAQLAIDATQFRTAEWAAARGLYAEVLPDLPTLDAAVQALTQRLATTSPEAMRELKQVLWAGTEHWDSLLVERAAISGRLVLSEFTRAAIG
ncbi:enoyl-CoA hydratase [Hymenobacter psoromatis]|nr:enoyl-CoA hydratase [Hymenobacter psoromatis]